MLLVAAFAAALEWAQPGFFFHDDNQLEHLPAALEIGRALAGGELPLISPRSWYGGALAGEYQYGVFSPYVLGTDLVVARLGLTLARSAALLAVLHLAVLAGGAYRLARQRGLSASLCLVVGLAAALNGWVIGWGTVWVNELSSFAWLPWLWWALERMPAERPSIRSCLLPAAFAYLILAGGHPFTDVMAVLVTSWIALRSQLRDRRLERRWPLAATWALAGGVAAPALLLLVQYYLATFRVYMRGISHAWRVPWTAWLGLVLPSIPVAWDTFSPSVTRTALEMSNGLVPSVAIGAALLLRGRAYVRTVRWELALLLVLAALAMAPTWGPFRWPFRWLALFHLVAALAAAEALRMMEAGTRWWDRVAPWALVLVGALWLFMPRLTPESSRAASWLLAAAAVWAVADILLFGRSDRATAWVPVAVVLLAQWTSLRHLPLFHDVPSWDLPEGEVRTADPLDPQRTYLALYTPAELHGVSPSGRLVGRNPTLLPGNLPMLAGVTYVNGYSPMGLLGLTSVFGLMAHGELDGRIAAHLTSLARRQGLFERIGIDGLVVPVRGAAAGHVPALLDEGWTMAGSTPEAVVLHRSGPPAPRVRAIDSAFLEGALPQALAEWERSSGDRPLLVAATGDRTRGPVSFAMAGIDHVTEARHRVEATVDVPASADALIVFSRAWYPGYRARLESRTLPVQLFDLSVPAVRVPAGSHGRLVLEYAPLPLRAGQVTAALTIVLVLAALVVESRRRRPSV